MTTNNSRSGLAVDLTATNRWLGEGETVKETDTGKVKIGPGLWNDLDYETTGSGGGGASGALEFWLGHPDSPYVPQGSVPIIGSRNRVSFGAGPYVLAAGESITFYPHALRGTTDKVLSMGDGQSELYVSNADCTQRLAVENDNVSDLLATLDTPIPISVIDTQVGTDLSIVNGNSIKSTAGGVFWSVAVITVDFT